MPARAAQGFHSLHAYTPATEPWQDWQGLSRSSAEPGDPTARHVRWVREEKGLSRIRQVLLLLRYKEKKKEAADFLYKAIERQAGLNCAWL